MYVDDYGGIVLKKRHRKNIICHSAKGSTWEKHKYVKVVDGVYFYPNDYKGGRHISSLAKSGIDLGLSAAAKALKAEGKKGGSAKEKDKDSEKIGNKKLEKLANDVIRGKYGNGKDRMDKLGKKYEKVQHRVNQILLGKAGAKKVLAKKKAAKKTSSKTTTKKSKTKTLGKK